MARWNVFRSGPMVFASMVMLACDANAGAAATTSETAGSTSMNVGSGETGSGETGSGETGSGETGDGDGDADELDLDGVVDITFTLRTGDHEPDFSKYSPGKLLRVYGHSTHCDEDVCVGPDWMVVRSDGGELLSATFNQVFPTAEVLAQFGLSPETWLEPLTVIAQDQDHCPVVPVCGDDSWAQRATYELVHPDGTARLIDQSVGWTAGGFVVSTARWEDGELSCVPYAAQRMVTLFRDECVDCPDPTFVDSCVPPDDDSTYAWLFVHLLPEVDGIWEGPFDATCEVLATEFKLAEDPGVRIEPSRLCVCGRADALAIQLTGSRAAGRRDCRTKRTSTVGDGCVTFTRGRRTRTKRASRPLSLKVKLGREAPTTMGAWIISTSPRGSREWVNSLGNGRARVRRLRGVHGPSWARARVTVEQQSRWAGTRPASARALVGTTSA